MINLITTDGETLEVNQEQFNELHGYDVLPYDWNTSVVQSNEVELNCSYPELLEIMWSMEEECELQ